MSSVNNSYGTYDSSTQDTSTASTAAKVVATATLPTDTDDISTSTAAAQALAASGAAPVLTTPDGQKVSMAAYGKVMLEFVQKFKDMVANDTESDIQNSASFYQTIISNILEIQALLSQQQDLEGNINGLMDQYAQSAAAVNAEIAKFNQTTNSAQDQAVIKTMQDAITTYNQALTTYNKAQADFASGTITQDELDQATSTFTDAQTTYNNAANAYNNYGAQRNQSLASQIQSYNTQVASGFSGLMNPVNASIDQYNAYAQEAGVATLSYPTVQQVKASTYMWASLPDATTTAVTPLASRPSAPTIAAALPPSANDNLDTFIGKIYDYISGIIDALLANLQLLVAQKNYAETSDDYDTDIKSKKSNSLNPVLDSSATNASSTELFASGSATYMQGASSQAFLTPFFAVSTPDFTTVVKQAIKKNDEKTSATTNTLLRAAAEQYLISAGLLGGKSAVGLLGDDISSVKPRGNASKVAVALGFTRELQKLSDSDIYDQGVSAILSAQGANPSAASTESTQKDAAALLRFNGALMSLVQLSQALNSPDVINDIIQLASGGGTPTPDQTQLKKDLLAKTAQLLQPELSNAKSHKIAEKLVDALLGDGAQSVVNVLRSTLAQYSGQDDMTQALNASMDRISSPQTNLDPLSDMLNDPGNNMLYAAKMGIIYAESQTHNHESGLQFPV